MQCWGQTSRAKRNSGTWHHFTADYRFSALEKRPQQLIETGCVASVEINYSVFDDTPLAVAFHTIYKKRWIARTWQEAGIVWLVHQRINTAKGTLTTEEFVEMCREVVEHHARTAGIKIAS